MKWKRSWSQPPSLVYIPTDKSKDNPPRPTWTPVPTDTLVPTDTPTPTPTDTPLPTSTPTPTNTPTDVPTSTPTDIPTNTPRPTNTPTATHLPTNTPLSNEYANDVPTNTPPDQHAYSVPNGYTIPHQYSAPPTEYSSEPTNTAEPTLVPLIRHSHRLYLSLVFVCSKPLKDPLSGALFICIEQRLAKPSAKAPGIEYNQMASLTDFEALSCNWEMRSEHG